MEDNINPGDQPIQPATPAPEEPAQPMQIPVNDSTVAENPATEEIAEPATEPEPTPETPAESAADDFASAETPLQSAIMQEIAEDDPEPSIKEPIVANEKPKGTRGLIILIVVLLFAAIGVAAAFAYLYFTKPTPKLTSSSSNTTSNTTPTPTPEPEPTPTPTPTPTPSSTFTPEGTAITDSDVVNELTEKTALILDIEPNEDLTFPHFQSIHHNDIDLIENGNLSEDQRVLAAIKYRFDDFRDLTDQEVDTIETEDSVSLLFTDKTAIEGDIVAEAYKELFGETLATRRTVDDGTHCPEYSYNTSLDVYYNKIEGCGGIAAYYRFYHVTDFTEDGNKAYIYVKVASINGETDGDFLCDVSSDYTNLKTTCGAGPVIPDTPIDIANTYLSAINFSDQNLNFAHYRFVFNQAGDGSYYFTGLEKV